MWWFPTPGALPVAVDAWIERDDAPFHSGRSRSQAVWLTAARPSSATAPPIQRLGTLNSLAHGTRTTVVGGSVRATGEMAAYSAAGPGRQKPVPGPDLVAPCEENIGLGLLAAGTRSGSQVRMAGTSVAAPLVARAIVNAGSVQALDTDPHRPALGERRHPPGAPVPDPRWHRGAFGLVEP
jgi:Subtilase family